MDIEYLRECIALADAMNFTKAAESCFVTQPTLSRHVRAVEQRLGIQLFDRTTHGVSITPEGVEVIGHFRHSVTSYDRAVAASRQAPLGLVLESPYYWTGDYTEPLLDAFSQELPHCEVLVQSCQPAEGVLKVLDGTADAAIDCTEYGGRALSRQPFATERLVAFVADDSPLANHQSISLSELASHGIVVINDDEGYYCAPDGSNTTLALFTSHGLTPAKVAEAQQVDLLARTIRESGGAAVTVSGVRHTDRSYIRVIPLRDDLPDLPLYLVWKRGNKSAALRKLLEVARRLWQEGACQP